MGRHVVTKAADIRDGAGLPAHEQVYRALREMVLFGALTPGDSLKILRFDAGLSTNTGDCPDFGQVVDVQDAGVRGGLPPQNRLLR